MSAGNYVAQASQTFQIRTEPADAVSLLCTLVKRKILIFPHIHCSHLKMHCIEKSTSGRAPDLQSLILFILSFSNVVEDI